MPDKQKERMVPPPQRGKQGKRDSGERGSQPDSQNYPGKERRNPASKSGPRDGREERRRRDEDELEPWRGEE
jgi:hypothetical protein